MYAWSHLLLKFLFLKYYPVCIDMGLWLSTQFSHIEYIYNLGKKGAGAVAHLDAYLWQWNRCMHTDKPCMKIFKLTGVN